MPLKTSFFWAASILLLVLAERFPVASAQYRSGALYPDRSYSAPLIGGGDVIDWREGYPYQRQPAPRLPTSSGHVGGFIGNPYRNDRIAPTGLPIGHSIHAYYGGGSSLSGGNPLVYRPASKPFSNATPTRPLISSREAARIEVSRGLWSW